MPVAFGAKPDQPQSSAGAYVDLFTQPRPRPRPELKPPHIEHSPLTATTNATVTASRAGSAVISKVMDGLAATFEGLLGGAPPEHHRDNQHDHDSAPTLPTAEQLQAVAKEQLQQPIDSFHQELLDRYKRDVPQEVRDATRIEEQRRERERNNDFSR